MGKKIKIPKSIKLYMINQLKKLPGLKLNSIINPRRLTSACKYPKTQSTSKRPIADRDRHIQEFFCSHYSSSDDGECSSSSTDTSSTSSPSETKHADLSSSTSNPFVAPSSATDNVREKEAVVPVVTFSSTDPYNEFKKSMMTILEIYRADNSQPLDQEFMEDLVFSYFAENAKQLHMHALRAFADIMFEIRRSSLRHEQRN